MRLLFFLAITYSGNIFGSIQDKPFFYTKPVISKSERNIINQPNTLNLEIDNSDTREALSTSIVFDIPITYNDKVKTWVQFYQKNGKKHFTTWLEKSQRYIPKIQEIFRQQGLPQDLAYLAMIESGLSPFATSNKQAVGYWQFIKPTAERYNLRINWWLDERRDLHKSTLAAAKYLRDINKMLNSWYLTAAGYNTGEYRVKRLVQKHGTKNFWEIAEKSFVQETKDYVPKLIAAILIAKAPSLYGFRNVKYKEPFDYEYFWAPGGTKISELADSISFSAKELQYLNPELIRGYIPEHVSGHRIRIPKGTLTKVSAYFKTKYN